MAPSTDAWTSLEISKLFVSILTPVAVAAIGWFISRRLKRLELIQWSNQKLIEKRLTFYDTVAPLLNKLLCFFTWVGYWKDVSPADVIKAKRDLDLAMNVYRHLFDEEVYANYQAFIHLLFETYTAPGHDAKIRSVIRGPDGNRMANSTYQWVETWGSHFAESDRVAPKVEVQGKYHEVMTSLTRSLGVHP